MLNIDKSNWKPVVKEEDKTINKLKEELLELYKEFYETTGDKSIFNFLDQSFKLLSYDKDNHHRSIYKISDSAVFEFYVLGHNLIIGENSVVMDGLFAEYIKPKTSIKTAKVAKESWWLF